MLELDEATPMYDESSLSHERQRLTASIAVQPSNAQLYIQRGMASFRLQDIAASIDDFDRAERLNPALTPYLWQRGLAYYYAERFEEGVRQFETDLRVNAHDVEETVWRYLCQAQIHGAHAARQALLPVGSDPRPLMSWVYQLFAGTCDAEQVIAQYRDGGQRQRFYSLLYVGLHCEAAHDRQGAQRYITQAVQMQVADDYMGWVALVHQRLRGWA